MKILYYISENEALNTAIKDRLAERGIEISTIERSLISAFGAMRIARAVDDKSIDIVIVSNSADAAAAVSARKLSRHPFKIIVEGRSNTRVPKGVPATIREGVDLWLFPSQRMCDSYPQNLRRTVVLPPPPAIETDALPYPDTNNGIIISWIGDITNRKLLQDAIKAVDDCDGAFTLHICGSGKAAIVMPAVKQARAIRHSDRVVWKADNYDLLRQIEMSHALVRSHDDLTESEIAALAAGRHVLDPDRLPDFIGSPAALSDTRAYTLANFIDRISEIFRDI